jgi:hypothetical protein
LCGKRYFIASEEKKADQLIRLAGKAISKVSVELKVPICAVLPTEKEYRQLLLQKYDPP